MVSEKKIFSGFPHYNPMAAIRCHGYGSYPLPWTPEFRSDLAQNLKQLFPHPNDASDKIWLQSVHWAQIY